MPLSPRASVTQRLPSRSTVAPCGKMNIFAPHDASSLPLASYLRIGASGLFAQEFAKQRWIT
jgi:hypothetical protein